MANEEHVALLRQDVAAWNAWRDENRSICPNLSGACLMQANLIGANLSVANLYGAKLHGATLSRANLHGADLRGADLTEATFIVATLCRVDLRGADLTRATLSGADLTEATFTGATLSGADLTEATLVRANLTGTTLSGASLVRADLTGADLTKATLRGATFSRAYLGRADLTGADLIGAILSGADLTGATLTGADLTEADLRRAYLIEATLTGANLYGANLENAALVETILRDADLTGCRIHGISAWDLKLQGSKQHNLVITRWDDPEITVDDIEVAQFVYLLLHNEKIRHVIDTITSKAVLILGRFTDERKAVLDALREELRKRNYVPILFDFDVPATRDITETVSLLAGMARFIIADLTDPSSIPKELEAIVPSLAVPVKPLLEGSSKPYAMFKDSWKYDWVLPVYQYEGLEPLLATLAEKVIAPAEDKVKALEERRRMIEAELTKPQ